MGTSQNLISSSVAVPTPSRTRLFVSAARYLFGKALTILVTIFAGVFVTLLIVSYPTGGGDEPGMSPFQLRLETQIDLVLRSSMYDGTIPLDANGQPDQLAVQALNEKLRSDAGLDLPYLPRQLLWTVKALAFKWGELIPVGTNPIGLGPRSRFYSKNIALEALPNTLLLVGTAYLLVFLIGIPLALHLARNHDSWLDRFLTILSPVSSVPSWVFAILLIAMFAVQLHWLPVGGMFDFHKSENPLKNIPTLIRHMLLPVAALVLSLLFQLIYTWRTFFLLYSEEDYVELARAKGLTNKTLEKQYILKPTLPYIITSFTISLIAFWQLTVALEAVFQWPGIGLLYIKSLPNYWKDAVQIGDLMIVIQIVVIFAYLLGILVFLLDMVYVFVDPRIHIIPASNVAQTNARVKTKRINWASLTNPLMKRKRLVRTQPVASPKRKQAFSWSGSLSNAKASLREARSRSWLFIQELRSYPSAIFGLVMIVLLLTGSVYAVIGLPYEQFGREFDENRVQGQNDVPRLAAPSWFNFFSKTPRLSTLIMDENSREATVSVKTLDNGLVEKTITFSFDYAYKDIPSDVFLYLNPVYAKKFPFASMVWTTADGRSINLKAQTVNGKVNYDFKSGISIAQLLNKNPEWKKWFVVGGQYPTPAFELLFAQPDSKQLIPQHGKYQLEIKSLFFEENSDLHPQLVLLGQVYGAAGTDYWRRDLIVPLFWGMPITLLIGFMGTLITALIAMVLPAIGVWFGGWLDVFIQRLTEVSMILPGLAIAVIANLLFGTSIWILLGTVVLLNALGGPIKTFRSAFLQAKEAPYMEVARSYGAGNFRIIAHYLVPRILPVFIPYLVSQIPSFIFLEATLGFFNIKSNYPSWGRIIYEGLSRGALYGSPFWVLEPIFLLLLTGLAFAMLGSALERILNPRIIADMPTTSHKGPIRPSTLAHASFNKRVIAISIAMVLFAAIFVPSTQGKTLAGVLFNFIDQTIKYDSRITKPSGPIFTRTPGLSSAPVWTVGPATQTKPVSTVTPISLITSTPLMTVTGIEETLPPTLATSQLVTYTLHLGEYPYCIARRLNVDPQELLILNGLLGRSTFPKGMVLQIPQTAKSFPAERQLRPHPRKYTVSTSQETLYTIACQFGDIDPLTIAQANQIVVDSALSIGQKLNIP